MAGAVKIGCAIPDNNQVDAWLNRRGADMPGYPGAASDFVATHVPRSSDRLINEFNWGGYLAWKMPAYQILLDGRTQLYTPEFWRETYLDDRAQTTRFLSHLTADAAILPTANSRFHASLTELGWKCVFRDERSEVLVPPASVVDTSE